MLNYTCIGHVCMDKKGNGFVPGGTAAFVAKLVSGLGHRVHMITSWGDDFVFEKDFEDISSHVINSPTTTIFQNIYSGPERVQYLHQKGDDLHIDAVDIKGDIIHFCPVIDEVPIELVAQMNTASFIGITPQGWLRKPQADGLIVYKAINWSKLQSADAIVISHEDVPASDLHDIIEQVPLLVVTEHAIGARAYHAGQVSFMPSWNTNPVDATGAGDAFACGFFMNYYHTKNIEHALGYGHCLASVCIEHQGIPSGDLKRVTDLRFRDYQNLYL